MNRFAGEPDARELARLFEDERPLRIGAEEEVMALHPETLELAPCAQDLLAELPPCDGFKLELPASQLEIVSPPCESLAVLAAQLLDGRRRLARGLAGRVRLAAAGVHPFAGEQGQLNSGVRYQRLAAEYGWAARRQLICGLHVHVSMPGAVRALAVYNEMRCHLPDIAALGANAPVYGARDVQMASVRPAIASALPRQGIPPLLESWEQFAGELRWGARAQRLDGFREWWWEMRLHAQLGTLEVRVPDSQSLAVDAGALAAVVAGLAVWLGRRHDAGELPDPVPSWRIAENRWSAARHGVKGRMADVRSGSLIRTGDRLHRLLEQIEPVVAELGGAATIQRAHELAECNGAERQRELYAERGAEGLTGALAESFLQEPESLRQEPPRQPPP